MSSTNNRHAHGTPTGRVALVACMRNEGLFVLEWIAYHRTLGFDAIAIVTNECTDGSDLLLDRLAASGSLIHFRQTPPPGTPPQDAGMDQVLPWARETGIDWILHIDSDEFLNIRAGNGRLPALMQNVGHADVVAIPWQMFGSAGQCDWTPGASVLRTFTRAEAGPTPRRTKSKCMFRTRSFARATDHNPLDPLIAAPVVVNPDGADLGNAALSRDRASRFRPYGRAASARTAAINHYAVKSDDLFLMKNDRGDGQGKLANAKYHLGSKWHHQADRNEIQDTSILRHWPATERMLADMRADPAVARLEQECFDWFTTRKTAILTPRSRQQWTKRERPANDP